MPRNRTTTTSLSSLVAGVLKDLKSGRRLSREDVEGVWARIAGEEASHHSWPRGLRSRRLAIEVENSGWMHSLGLRRQELLEGAVELFGARRVKELSFRIGERSQCQE